MNHWHRQALESRERLDAFAEAVGLENWPPAHLARQRAAFDRLMEVPPWRWWAYFRAYREFLRVMAEPSDTGFMVQHNVGSSTPIGRAAR